MSTENDVKSTKTKLSDDEMRAIGLDPIVCLYGPLVYRVLDAIDGADAVKSIAAGSMPAGSPLPWAVGKLRDDICEIEAAMTDLLRDLGVDWESFYREHSEPADCPI
jgi:hypothetical protein